MKVRIFKVIFAIVFCCYPLLIYLGFKFKLGNILIPTLLVLAVFRLVTLPSTENSNKSAKNLGYATSIFLLSISTLSLIFDNMNYFKLYPILINLTFLYFFANSIFSPKSMIEKFASVYDKDITPVKSLYMRNLTKVWCGYFIINCLISLYTALYCSLEIWTIYNGLISYIIMGTLFITEFLYRQRFLKKENKR